MTDIAGNRIYLVCTICGADTQHSLMLGMRRGNGYFKAPDRRMLDAWYEEHAKCGDTLDHFKLAMQKPANWDRPLPISPDTNVDLAVKLALVN